MIDAVGGAIEDGGYAVVCSSGPLLLVVLEIPVKEEGKVLLDDAGICGVLLSGLDVLDLDAGRPTLTSPMVTDVASPGQYSTMISVVSPWDDVGIVVTVV